MRGEIVLWMYVTTDTLYHHGIKGQHWGVRRFQNEDGSLTAAGRRRYDVDIEGAKNDLNKAKNDQKKALRDYNTATGYGMKIDQKATAKLNKANQKVQWTKDNLKNEKIKSRLNNEKSKSKHRLNLEEEYRKKGMSQEEAEIAAYKRAKTEKVIGVTAALTVAAAASYVAYRHYDKSVDKIISADTLFSRISPNDTASVHDAFYAASNKSDKTKYLGIYGDQLRNQGHENIYQKSIRATSAIKVASEKSATNALSELVSKNPTYAKTLQSDMESRLSTLNMFNSSDKQREAVKRGIESLKKGKVDSHVYTALNYGLADNTSESTKGFYKHMASKGYDAVVDLNDKKLSGFMAKMPMVVFNSSKTTVDNVRKVGEQEIQKAKASGLMNAQLKTLAPSLVKTAGVGAGITVGTKAMSSATTAKQRNAVIDQYKRDHPNTKLSNSEILRNYFNS